MGWRGSGPQASRGADNREERGTLRVGTPNPPWWCLCTVGLQPGFQAQEAEERRHESDLDLVDLLDMTPDRMLDLVGLPGGPLADATLWRLEVIEAGHSPPRCTASS